MLAVVFVPWFTKPAWARTEVKFSADDPWNDNRPAVFTIESYVPSLTGKPVGPWEKGVTVWMTAFMRALRSEADGAAHFMPESLTDLWLSGQVPLQAVPWLLKEIQPSLKQLDYRGTPSAQVPALSMALEWVGLLLGLFIAAVVGFTSPASLTVRLLFALGFVVAALLLGYPSITIRRHRRKQQMSWLLERMRTRSEASAASKKSVELIVPSAPVGAAVDGSEKMAAEKVLSMRSLDEIQTEFARISDLIGAKNYWATLPSLNPAANQRYGRTAIEVDAVGYHFLCNDRGQEFEFAVTTDFEKILYWSFKEAVSLLAADYARAHKIPGEDWRRIANPRGIELFGLISAACAERWKAEIARSMEIYPYDDAYDLRLSLHQQFLGQGVRGDESWRTVLEKYPAKTANQSLRPF